VIYSPQSRQREKPSRPVLLFDSLGGFSLSDILSLSVLIPPTTKAVNALGRRPGNARRLFSFPLLATMPQSLYSLASVQRHETSPTPDKGRINHGQIWRKKWAVMLSHSPRRDDGVW
jgi:hypothetical protein